MKTKAQIETEITSEIKEVSRKAFLEALTLPMVEGDEPSKHVEKMAERFASLNKDIGTAILRKVADYLTPSV